MHFTTYVLPTLLAITPAFVYANGCTHFETTYIVPCPGDKCPGGKIDDYLDAFTNNGNAFRLWAGGKGVGGSCGGACANPRKVDWGHGGAGYTFIMRCVAPRMANAWAQGIPGHMDGLERINTNRACNVNCSPNGWATYSQGCGFRYGEC
ncbi:Protein transport protein [Venturia nashicola]|uniref:Protein transport protein n=1 Tax=Venturia nashicola TaxID=86259 RepID=A0A4Z1P3B2_9PEZI|nr:Protein transport protein [Venturia nashicola]TLD32482.1 Protein transport protein [Venturia nashicola]